jgi:hypothetical protein
MKERPDAVKRRAKSRLGRTNNPSRGRISPGMVYRRFLTATYQAANFERSR